MSWSLGFQPTLRSANRACRATCYVVAYALVRKVKSPALVIGVRWGELGCTNKAGKEPLSHLAMSRNLVLPLFLCGMVSHLRQEDRFRGSSGIAVVATTPDRSRDCQRPRLIARCSLDAPPPSSRSGSQRMKDWNQCRFRGAHPLPGTASFSGPCQ
jgi:hypothetical protein